MYDRLFNVSNPSDETGVSSFLEYLNPDSVVVMENAKIESGLKDAKPGDKFQFMRQGYFCVDRDSTPEKLVFNRTVGLKDSWKGGK